MIQKRKEKIENNRERKPKIKEHRINGLRHLYEGENKSEELEVICK